jgi:hypothetical protein
MGRRLDRALATVALVATVVGLDRVVVDGIAAGDDDLMLRGVIALPLLVLALLAWFRPWTAGVILTTMGMAMMVAFPFWSDAPTRSLLLAELLLVLPVVVGVMLLVRHRSPAPVPE